jgi:hypothetical protein
MIWNHPQAKDRNTGWLQFALRGRHVYSGVACSHKSVAIGSHETVVLLHNNFLPCNIRAMGFK